MSRLLVLDYGSNSLRWLVVDRVDPRGMDAPLGPVESGGRSTGLGRPGEDGRISQEAVEQTLAATGEAVARGRALGAERIIAVATHFARELTGVEALADALKSRWGVELTLLSGTDEAWLTRVGVEEGLRCLGLDGRVFLAVDVGGGSTELSWWGGRELITRSFPLGAISLTAHHLHGDPPAPGEMDELKAGVRAVFEDLPADTKGLPVVASGGTATALAALFLGLN
jgi:exopolyphosphatase/guanosine-5'-triphosphate,3'-diphosphate pyrophosphatase